MLFAHLPAVREPADASHEKAGEYGMREAGRIDERESEDVTRMVPYMSERGPRATPDLPLQPGYRRPYKSAEPSGTGWHRLGRQETPPPGPIRAGVAVFSSTLLAVTCRTVGETFSSGIAVCGAM